MRLGNEGVRLQTAETTLAVIEGVRELEGARVTELAEYLGVSKSTAHNHLSTLRQNGYLSREGDEYDLSLAFANLGRYARHRREGYAAASELTERASEETGLEADFIVEENGRGVYLVTKARAEDPNVYPHVGDWLYLHSVAAGKAILAGFPDRQVDRVIDKWGLPPLTPNTITDPAELFAELETIRTRGYALNRGENTEGVRAVGVAVHDDTGTPMGAVSVISPSYRLSDDYFEEELPEMLVRIVNEFDN